MPIWRSSELLPGRAGSPSRRNSARTSQAQTNTSRSAGLQLVSNDRADDTFQPQGPLSGHAVLPKHSMRRAGSACNSVSSFSSWEPSQSGSLTTAGTQSVKCARDWSLPTDPEFARQQLPAHVMSPRQRVASGTEQSGAVTYTVQYIGIANGELGILSQKQKLASARSPGLTSTPITTTSTNTAADINTTTSTALAGRVAELTRRRSRSAVVHTSPTANPGPFPHAPSRAGAGVIVRAARTEERAFPLASSSGPPAGPPREPPGVASTPSAPLPLDMGAPEVGPSSAMLQTTAKLVQTTSGSLQQPHDRSPVAGLALPGMHMDTAEVGPEGHSSELKHAQATSIHGDSHEDARADATSAADRPSAAGGAPSSASVPASPDVSGGAKAPSLTHIVDDARGQMKVITECFYSRALHSRAAPHDRHGRRNRPIGPQVRDMEPLNTGLPNRFGHRAPSAGGFSGWKLTAAGSAGALGWSAKEALPRPSTAAGPSYGSITGTTAVRRQRASSAGASRSGVGRGSVTGWQRSGGGATEARRDAGG